LPRGYNRIRFCFALTVLSVALAGRYRPFPDSGLDALNDVEVNAFVDHRLLLSRFSGFEWNHINPLHVIVAGIALVAIVPFNGDVLRVRRIDRPLIGFIAVEIDAVAGFESEGLFGGHFAFALFLAAKFAAAPWTNKAATTLVIAPTLPYFMVLTKRTAIRYDYPKPQFLLTEIRGVRIVLGSGKVGPL